MQPVRTNSPLINRARQEAVYMASTMIERSVQAALRGMEEAQRLSGSVATRLQLADALTGLSRCRLNMRSAFPVKVDQAILEGLESARENADLPPPPVDSEHVLALLEEAEITRFVEASRLQQTAMPIVERSLARLDSLISSALGLPVVRADLNPLRPDLLCNALLQLVEEQPEPPEVRSHWVRHMAKQFAQDLALLYGNVAKMLENQGVEEARYRVKLSDFSPLLPMDGGMGGSSSSSGSHASHGREGGSRGAGAGADYSHSVYPPLQASAGASRTRRVPLPDAAQLARAYPAASQALVRDFLYQPQWLTEQEDVLPEDYHEQVRAEMAEVASTPFIDWDEEAEMSELAHLRELSVVERPARPLAVESPLSPRQWGEHASPQARAQALMALKARADKLSQVLGLDAVRTLVNQVAGDERVLAPVREAFVALEPALLRMAMADPRYFGDDSHPARRLLEEVAQRSFNYNDEFSPDFEQFIEPVRQAVRELNAKPAPNRDDFAHQVHGLQERWKAEDESEKTASEKGVGSMRFAQERQALADRIAWEFSLRSDLDGVPVPVSSFLYQDWSLVIAHAQMTAERSQLDPGGYLAVVSDLLWSVKPEAALRQPRRLFEVVPGIISTLRRGLAMLDKDPAETRSFFDTLMVYHDPVLRLRRLRSALDFENTGAAPVPTESQLAALGIEPPPAERPKPRAAEQPWLGRAERQAAGFHDPDTHAAPDEHDGDEFPDTEGFADTETWLEQAVGAGRTGEQPRRAAPPAAPTTSQSEESDDDALARTRAALARLHTGDWVDLRVRDQWRRAKLVWSSDNGALFMFTSHGGRVHSMTRRTCEKLIRTRHLRPIDAGAVVDKALRTLTDKPRALGRKRPAKHTE